MLDIFIYFFPEGFSEWRVRCLRMGGFGVPLGFLGQGEKGALQIHTHLNFVQHIMGNDSLQLVKNNWGMDSTTTRDCL